jgi:hypothetical protein
MLSRRSCCSAFRAEFTLSVRAFVVKLYTEEYSSNAAARAIKISLDGTMAAGRK